MEKNLHFKILPEYKVVYILCIGIVHLFEVEKMMKEISSSSDYCPTFNVLVNLKYCIMNMKSNTASEFHAYLRDELYIENKRLIAFLTSTPNQVTLTTLYGMEVEETDMRVAVFSTIKPALKYVLENKSKINTLKTYLEALTKKVIIMDP